MRFNLWRPHLSLLIINLLFSACIDANSSESDLRTLKIDLAIPPSPVEEDLFMSSPEGAPFGEPCTGPSNCLSGICYSRDQVSSGYCTVACESTQACPDEDWTCQDQISFGYICVPTALKETCETCSFHWECPAQTQCIDTEEGMRCVPKSDPEECDSSDLGMVETEPEPDLGSRDEGLPLTDQCEALPDRTPCDDLDDETLEDYCLNNVCVGRRLPVMLTANEEQDATLIGVAESIILPALPQSVEHLGPRSVVCLPSHHYICMTVEQVIQETDQVRLLGRPASLTELLPTGLTTLHPTSTAILSENGLTGGEEGEGGEEKDGEDGLRLRLPIPSLSVLIEPFELTISEGYFEFFIDFDVEVNLNPFSRDKSFMLGVTLEYEYRIPYEVEIIGTVNQLKREHELLEFERGWLVSLLPPIWVSVKVEVDLELEAMINVSALFSGVLSKRGGYGVIRTWRTGEGWMAQSNDPVSANLGESIEIDSMVDADFNLGIRPEVSLGLYNAVYGPEIEFGPQYNINVSAIPDRLQARLEADVCFPITFEEGPFPDMVSLRQRS